MARKARAKAPPKELTHPQRAPKRHYFTELAKTEEGRALRKSWSLKPRKRAGRPKGVPDGHTEETIKPLRDAAKLEAKKVATIMFKEAGREPDQFSREALETAVEIMRVKGETRERLAAARLVLDFTKSKPASQQNVTIGKAEQFLASLITDEEESEQIYGQEVISSQEEIT